MCAFMYGFIIGIPLNILIIYGKDPNIKVPYYLNMYFPLLKKKII